MAKRYRRPGYRPYIAVYLGAELASKIDAYRFRHRFPKCSQALCNAIVAGLDVLASRQAEGDTHGP